MAMSITNGGRGGRRWKRARTRPMSEINVTPMVDVMLVLLIIFMVTAPLLTVGVKVELPKTDASLLNDPSKHLSVVIKSDGSIYLQKTPIELRALTARAIAISGANPNIKISVSGDRNIDYGRVMQVMGTLTRAGFRKLNFLTDPAGGIGTSRVKRLVKRPAKPKAKK